MSSLRAVLDSALKRVVPAADESVTPRPRELCPGLWTLDRQLRHFGVALLPSRTTIARLSDGSLVVISPPTLVDSNTVAAIDSVGRVAYVVVPSSFHYLYATEFMKHYPEASLLTAPGVLARVPGLEADAELELRAPGAWAGALEYVVLGPVRGVSEVLFFHVSSATLILTDLAFNMTHYPRTLDRLIWRASGIPRGFGPGRTTRSLLLHDRAEASRALRQALDWPIERIVVAHGDVVDHDALGQLRRAFAAFVAS